MPSNDTSCVQRKDPDCFTSFLKGIKMKKITSLITVLFLLPGFNAWSEVRGEAGSEGRAPAAPRPQMVRSPAPARQPVVINMNRGSSGGHNRNYPSQHPAPAVSRPPSYGQLRWNNPAPAQSKPQSNPRPILQSRPPAQPQPGTAVPIREGAISAPVFNRPPVKNYVQPGVKAAVAVHHHAYTPGYVRQKLQKLGVQSEPSLITDRSEIIATDKAHSTIRVPEKGPDHQVITAVSVSPRNFNDKVVRDQMARVDSSDWQGRVDQFNASERQAGHYYWHNDGGFNYCHYLDSFGYNWYGWYVGSQYFWTRNFNSRWWWYDSDFNRWCFWNSGYWWWQDPNHVGDLYCYNGNTYIPCNSQDDQVVVTAPDNANLESYASPDGTRVVKVDTETQDAFLYDTADPPSFDPVYLASGVESVQFSDAANGRPMEIILVLNDKSYDLFDAQGNAYNPGAFDQDQANSSAAQDDNPTNTEILQRMDTPDSGSPNN